MRGREALTGDLMDQWALQLEGEELEALLAVTPADGTRRTSVQVWRPVQKGQPLVIVAQGFDIQALEHSKAQMQQGAQRDGTDALQGEALSRVARFFLAKYCPDSTDPSPRSSKDSLDAIASALQDEAKAQAVKQAGESACEGCQESKEQVQAIVAGWRADMREKLFLKWRLMTAETTVKEQLSTICDLKRDLDKLKQAQAEQKEQHAAELATLSMRVRAADLAEVEAVSRFTKAQQRAADLCNELRVARKEISKLTRTKLMLAKELNKARTEAIRATLGEALRSPVQLRDRGSRQVSFYNQAFGMEWDAASYDVEEAAKHRSVSMDLESIPPIPETHFHHAPHHPHPHATATLTQPAQLFMCRPPTWRGDMYHDDPDTNMDTHNNDNNLAACARGAAAAAAAAPAAPRPQSPQPPQPAAMEDVKWCDSPLYVDDTKGSKEGGFGNEARVVGDGAYAVVSVKAAGVPAKGGAHVGGSRSISPGVALSGKTSDKTEQSRTKTSSPPRSKPLKATRTTSSSQRRATTDPAAPVAPEARAKQGAAATQASHAQHSEYAGAKQAAAPTKTGSARQPDNVSPMRDVTNRQGQSARAVSPSDTTALAHTAVAAQAATTSAALHAREHIAVATQAPTNSAGQTRTVSPVTRDDTVRRVDTVPPVSGDEKRAAERVKASSSRSHSKGSGQGQKKLADAAQTSQHDNKAGAAKETSAKASAAGAAGAAAVASPNSRSSGTTSRSPSVPAGRQPGVAAGRSASLSTSHKPEKTSTDRRDAGLTQRGSTGAKGVSRGIGRHRVQIGTGVGVSDASSGETRLQGSGSNESTDTGSSWHSCSQGVSDQHKAHKGLWGQPINRRDSTDSTMVESHSMQSPSVDDLADAETGSLVYVETSKEQSAQTEKLPWWKRPLLLGGCWAQRPRVTV